MKKYKIKFTLVANGEATVTSTCSQEAINKLLAKDAIDIVSLMNIFESDLCNITVEEAE